MQDIQVNKVIKLKEKLRSCDGLEKYLFETFDGFMFEGVSMYVESAFHLGLSSQIGCSYQCRHCTTGSSQFKRNLSYEEIVQQAEIMAKGDSYYALFMAMGEPFENFNNVLKSIDFMEKENFLAEHPYISIGAVIGTSGVFSFHDSLTILASRLRRPHIAVSIHAVPDSLRSIIIPHSLLYSLNQLEHDLLKYQQLTGDKVTFEYTPIHGLNDSHKDFVAFALWVQKFYCVVRIIPLNPIFGNHFKPSSPQKLKELAHVLEIYGISYLFRPSYGVDIFGGCGQLGVLSQAKS